MGFLDRLMLFVSRLRDPHAKPAYVEDLEERQHEVAKRLSEVERRRRAVDTRIDVQRAGQRR